MQKQQRLNDLLKQHNDKHIRTNEHNRPKAKVIEISDDEEAARNEEIDSQSIVSDSGDSPDSDDVRDHDFMIRQVAAKSKKKAAPKQSVSPTASEQFTCDYCNQTFKAKQGLTRHVQSHIELSIPWTCDHDDCHFAASSKIKLNLHKNQTHNIPMSLLRPQNGHAAEIKPVKKVVADVPASDKEWFCFCGATFLTIFSLRAHKK